MKQSNRKSMPFSPKEWIVHAHSDLALAKRGIGDDEILPQQICFHAQQAVEKALKAVLLYNKVDFPLTHDIVELLNIFEEAGISVPHGFSEVGMLTPYAVETRYPGYRDEITKKDVEDALQLAEMVVSWAGKYISKKK